MLQVGIAIVTQRCTVAGISGIQAVGILPCVRHAVTVGICRSSCAVKRRPWAPCSIGIGRFQVILSIDETGIQSGALV